MAEAIGADVGMTDRLLGAIKAGDAVGASALLEREPGLANSRGSGGLSPIMLATYVGRPDLVELLLASGAEVDVFAAAARGDVGRLEALLAADAAHVEARSPDGWTPLHLAAHFGHKRAARALLDRGAAPDARSGNAMLNTPLHAALAGRHADVAELLLAYGAAVNATQHGGFTALHAAAQHGDLRLAELLLAHGADASAATDDGRTALMMADERGHAEVADLVRRRAEAA